MKTLYLVRHAKSSWSHAGLSDRERPLNNRGLKNAPEMGKRLSVRGQVPDLIISSPANRALSTARLISNEIGYQSDLIQIEKSLYFEGTSSMLNLIRSMDDSMGSLMLVAHNPDMTSMVNGLCGFQIDNMPTCAIATIQFDGEWRDIEFNSGQLVDYDYPKKSADT